MAQRVEILDLATLGLSSGEGRSLELDVPVEALAFGGEEYAPAGDVPALLDVSRTTGDGYALRVRMEFDLVGPCMRCLEPARQAVALDVREVDQPGGGEELTSPYLTETELDVKSWVRDSIALAMPSQVLCRPDCRGLCPRCGQDLNADPEHQHEPEIDPRLAKLSEIKFD